MWVIYFLLSDNKAQAGGNPARRPISGFCGSICEQSVLLGPVERQIEPGQTRRCELVGLRRAARRTRRAAGSSSSTYDGGESDICRDQQVCMTLRWREMDSNLYGAFPVKWCFSVYCQFFVRSGKWPFFIPSPTIRFAERAQMGSRDRNASKAWRLAA
jgi:hypothetical protein